LEGDDRVRQQQGESRDEADDGGIAEAAFEGFGMPLLMNLVLESGCGRGWRVAGSTGIRNEKKEEIYVKSVLRSRGSGLGSVGGASPPVFTGSGDSISSAFNGCQRRYTCFVHAVAAPIVEVATHAVELLFLVASVCICVAEAQLNA